MQKLIYQNHDYQQIQIQQTQKHFNLGCDFIVTSKVLKILRFQIIWIQRIY